MISYTSSNISDTVAHMWTLYIYISQCAKTGYFYIKKLWDIFMNIFRPIPNEPFYSAYKKWRHTGLPLFNKNVYRPAIGLNNDLWLVIFIVWRHFYIGTIGSFILKFLYSSFCDFTSQGAFHHIFTVALGYFRLGDWPAGLEPPAGLEIREKLH